MAKKPCDYSSSSKTPLLAQILQDLGRGDCIHRQLAPSRYWEIMMYGVTSGTSLLGFIAADFYPPSE